MKNSRNILHYKYKETYLASEDKSEIVMVRSQEKRRAKVGGTCVIADGKFQLSVISGLEIADGWNFPSAITHVPPTFARLLS